MIGEFEKNPDSDGNHTGNYSYVVYNSQKFYRNRDNMIADDMITDDTNRFFWYGSDYRKNFVSSSDMINALKDLFEDEGGSNTPGLRYYEEAVVFSNWVNDKLGTITQADAEVAFTDDSFTQISREYF